MKESKTEIQGMYKISDGIVINKDELSLLKYKKEKNNMQKIAFLEKNVSSMKDDIKEIKDLLRSLVK
jgi:hypothetical protein